MKNVYIQDLPRFENQAVTGFFVAGSRQIRPKKDGSQFLALTLCDRTGQMEARMWEAQDAGEFAAGDVIKLRGQVCRYQDKLQINIDRVRRATPDEYELGDFVPQTERNIDELWTELERVVSSLQDADLKRLLRSFLDDTEIAAMLRQAPAAKSMHHAWIGGLLEHIVSLLGICELAAHHYSSMINRDLLLTGAVLHDIGKLKELRWGTSFDYTLPGQLLGHITLGLGMIDAKLDTLEGFPPAKRVLVQHMVLSHHGRYEFGSPKLPMLPEAILLHYLDDLDAKMQTLGNEFARQAANGRAAGEMTEWVRSLERPLLHSGEYLKAALATSETSKTESTYALPFED